MARKIRLSDIAAQAGVSTATVSRVLNGKDSVAADTRQAVIAALDLLGYERREVTARAQWRANWHHCPGAYQSGFSLFSRSTSPIL